MPVKKFLAEEEAMNQPLQELRKKIVDDLQLKDLVEQFLNCCKENMPDCGVPNTIFFRDGIPRNPAGKVLVRVLKQEVQAV